MAESPRVDADLPPVPMGTHPWVAQWQNRIGFGVSIFPQPPDWQGFIRLVQRMESMGVDSYWSYDHPAANADCWTALAALAVSTERIRLGTMVDCIYYRSPTSWRGRPPTSIALPADASCLASASGGWRKSSR